MSSKISSIYVVGLACTSRYVDHFLVEIYSDSGLTTRVGSQTATATLTNGVYTQNTFISFDGLIFGNTYYLRATAVAPVTNAVNWSSTFTQVAGATTAPTTVTYGGNFTNTLTGVNIYALPATIPTDIAYYEGTWTWDLSTPPNSSTALATNLTTDTTGHFHFYVGGVPDNPVMIYVRAVNTAGLKQNWVSLGEFLVGSNYDGILQTATGVNNNLVPDSGLQFQWSYWTNPGPSWTISLGTGISGTNAFTVTPAASGTYQYSKSTILPLVSGKTYTLSASIDATHVTAGSPGFFVYNTAITTGYASLGQTPGANGRVSTTFTFNPSGVAAGTTANVVLLFDMSNCTFSGGNVLGSAPMIQAGSVLTGYLPGVGDNVIGYFPRGTHPPEYNVAIDGNGNVQNLGGVTSTSITPIAGLMPSQAGADVTSQNTDILLQNPNFIAGDSGWSKGTDWTIIAGTGYIPGSGYLGNFSAATATSSLLFNQQTIPCSAGSTISAACYVAFVTGPSGGYVSNGVFVNFYNTTGGLVGGTTSTDAMPAQGNWGKSRVVATAPVGSAYAQIGFQAGSCFGLWRVCGFTASILANSLDEVNDGPIYKKVASVVGGKVTTASILAGAVSASLSYTVTTPQTISSGTVATCGTVTQATNGGFVSVRACFDLQLASSGTTEQVRVIMYKGSASGTVLAAHFPSAPASGAVIVSFETVDVSPASSQLYTLTVDLNGAVNTIIVSNLTMLTTNFKV